MSDIFRDLEQNLPRECLAAVRSGEAVVVSKFGNFAIVDADEADLFKCLPLIMTRYGFAIVINYNGKTSTTNLGEIVCRKRGIVRFKNNFKCDYRKSNLEIKEWPLKVKH